MALSANQVDIILSAQDQATKVIDRVRKSLNTLSNGAKSSGSVISKAFGAIKNSIFNLKTGIAGLIGVGGFGALTKSVLTVGGAFEDYKATLKSVLGSQEAANKSFAWVQEFAQSTPFEVDQLTEAFVRLSAYGIKGEDVMKTLGDTAAAMGKDIMQAVEALADAQTGEFERLKEFGVKAIQITKANATQLGASLADVGQTALTYTDRIGKEQVKIVDRNNRAIVTSTLMSIWNSRYEGAMEERSKTMNGMLSNLADSWTNWQNKVAEIALPKVKEALQSLLDSIQRFSQDGTLDGWANGLANSIQASIAWLTGFVQAFEGAFMTLGKTLGYTSVNFDEIREGARNFGWEVLTALKDVYDWLTKNGEGMWNGIKTGAKDLLFIITTLANGIRELISLYARFKQSFAEARENVSNSAIKYRSSGAFGAGALAADVAIGTRASGGGVMAGQSYLVGEKGAEVFTPTKTGNISNSAGGQTVVNNIYTAATAHGINNALASRSDTAVRSTRVGMTVSNSRVTTNFGNLSGVRSR